MLFAFFSLAILAVTLYFRQVEKKWDHVLMALAVFPMFLQATMWLNDDLYKTIAFEKHTQCVADGNTTSCIEWYALNENRSALTFSVLDYYSMRSFDMQFIRISDVILFGVLIATFLYVAYKGLKTFGYIKE